MQSMAERLLFNSIKEDRGRYFVEYSPPNPSTRFATLQVTTPDDAEVGDVARFMETEIELWLKRYPVPVMVSAFDGKGDLYDLSSVRPCDHLLGYSDEGKNEPLLFWKLLEDNKIPAHALNIDYLKRVYSSIPYKTSESLREDSEKHSREMRLGWAIIFAWLVVVPAIIAILGWASPFVSLIALLYSLWKAVKKGLELTGKWKKSPREIKKDEEERAMLHHHYHCVRNPEGFLRLKLENFERWEREHIQGEAAALQPKSGTEDSNEITKPPTP